MPRSTSSSSSSRARTSVSPTHAKKHAATIGDLVVMDFDGSVDGKPFEGGKGEDMSVEIGSGQLIPGFEEQLVGAKSATSARSRLRSPRIIQSENLEGKPATFAVTVKAVKTAGETKIDDEFAKSLGLQTLDQLQRPDCATSSNRSSTASRAPI